MTSDIPFRHTAAFILIKDFNEKYDMDWTDEISVFEINPGLVEIIADLLLNGKIPEEYDHGFIPCYIGKYYECIKADKIMAEHYYMIGVEKFNNMTSMNNLAVLYENQGRTEEAIEYYKMAIDRDCTPAMYNLALLYEEQGSSIQTLNNNHHMNKDNAACKLGLCNHYDDPEEYNLANEYYLMGIEKGDANCMFGLGDMCENQEDYDLAKQYFLMGVEKGDTDCMFALAHLYDFHFDNVSLAKKYNKMGIEKGCFNCMSALGHIYQRDDNHKYAKKYFLMAIKHDAANDSAMCGLGKLCENQGQIDQAKKHYRKAITLGCVQSMQYMGSLYRRKYRYGLAKKYYLMAIEKNQDVESMFELAEMYKSLGKNKFAKKYHQMAIDEGHVESMIALGDIYESEDTKAANAKALDYYDMVLKNRDGDVDTLRKIAHIYKKDGYNDTAF
jgi:tetratricopeptide (TPR) repeat protein